MADPEKPQVTLPSDAKVVRQEHWLGNMWSARELVAKSASDQSSEKATVSDIHPSGVIGTLLKKHFSWENLVVLLVGDGIGLSLCIAAGDAALKKDWGPMLAGFGIGLPLMAIATSFPFWKNYVAKWLRESIVNLAFGGLAVGLLIVVVYVLGPYIFVQQPKGQSADEIAAAVVRALPKVGPPASNPAPPPPVAPPYVNPLHDPAPKWGMAESLRSQIQRGGLSPDCHVTIVQTPVDYAEDYAAEFKRVLDVVGWKYDPRLAAAPVDKGITVRAVEDLKSRECANALVSVIRNNVRTRNGSSLNDPHRWLSPSEAPEYLKSCPLGCVEVDFGIDDGR